MFASRLRSHKRVETLLVEQLKTQQAIISHLEAEIERLNLLLALTLARNNVTRARFIEVSRLLRSVKPSDDTARHSKKGDTSTNSASPGALLPRGSYARRRRND
jgi:hypothetical protein